ncbi:D-amino acid dehydrogenase [Manganibacter manganicus]|uniref:D-amino acid dehydrogenase n=1 Tax=Manganibacter manganicus TaxID=1873176 RepID=A0A1V8RNE8_9HYPH|nr:D-amino acid dehydrogenase [Pseudaminobacter manganicus]OQM74686.1 D-amino acid dehydrogenase small subunit [Pseudaminobacter manganicus]
MKVLILGSGVIGVTSAYFLAEAGHEVTVIDRQPGPALETSFANAGEISPGYSSPWAGPGVPVKALKWLTMKHGPLVIRPGFDRHMWSWMLKMLRNCTAERYAVNKSRMVPVAEYSRDVLKALRSTTNIAYDERAKGTLQLFRTQKQLDSIGGDVEVLKQTGVPFEVLDPEGCIAAEPGLGAVREKFVGGLRLPGDETGDCQMFTERLAEIATAAGVKFEYGVTLTGIETAQGKVTGVTTSAGPGRADAYVMALGSYSPIWMRKLGQPIPVYPVKGYSITVPIVNASAAPESTIMDETYKIAITRLGDRIRVGGTAEISGYNLSLNDARRDTLIHSVTDLFPAAGDISKATFWTGQRPMTPDGPPIIGLSKYANLYLNTGHGTLGWTMSCGSARVLADIMSGRAPDIDASALGPQRYAA